MTEPRSDYDSPWKEALDRYFAPFLALCFPHVHTDIDWSRPYEFLDKELQRIVRSVGLGRRIADKLVRVHRLDGSEARVLVHIEVQGDPDPEFPERMYVCNTRIFDQSHRPVASLAVLTDAQPGWRPNRYSRGLWGSALSMEFPICKLLDFESRWEELEASDNPFSVVVMAHLRSLATQRDPEGRLQSKVRLVRGLYERGFSREDILELFRLIDWIVALPGELEQAFDAAVEAIDEEQRMPYITSYERRAIERGRQEGLQEGEREATLRALREVILEVLTLRFKSVPEEIEEQVRRSEDADWLRGLHRAAVQAGSMAEFRREMDT